MKHKVMIVIDHLGEGGAQRQIIEYLKLANRNSFDITVVNLDAAYNTVGKEIEDLGYRVIAIKHSGLLSLSTLNMLIRLFRKEKPDIVHTYLFTADCYGRLAARLARVKVTICAIRAVDKWKKWYHIAADWILTLFTDKVTVNAEAIKPFLVKTEKFPPEKIVTIYNGIDLDRFNKFRASEEVKKELGIPQDAFVVAMVGRLDTQKDYPTYFAAAEKVLEKYNNVYFLAVGGGPLLQVFKSQVLSFKLKERIIFTGVRRDVLDLINALDIGILSSHYEGCPNVVMEYMACSKPVIATNVDGCSELIVDDLTGYLVPPKSPGILADKIIQLLDNPDLRMKMGQEGRKRVETLFTSEIMVKNTENLYKELLQSKIAYLMSQFPETHETFILRELNAMKDKGAIFEILSLKPCKDKVIHPEAVELMKKTVYGRALSSWLIIHSIRHPFRTVSALLYVIKSYYKTPNELIKALYVFLECSYFARVIEKEKINHIHSHWATMPTTAAMILSKMTGVSFSFTAHAWDIFLNANGLAKKIERSRFAVTCSSYNKRFLDENFIKGRVSKIYLNYHGIDLDKMTRRELRATTPNKLKILAIGRLVETKGFEDLLKACRILKDKGIEFECDIIGEGPLSGSLKSQVSSLKLEERVKFLGIKTQNEIKKLYSEATMLVQPSVVAKNGDRDGIPNVILEAMALGVPVVSTRISGIPEVVIDGETGILVPERDAHALAGAIERLGRDGGLREKFGINARRMVEEKFSTEKNIAQLIKIFQENGVL